MTPTLYSNYLNSAGERVRIALALKGIDYDYVSVGQMGWDVYETINPQRLMPALKIGDHIVPQATAILEYLEETYPEPALLPADPVLRAQARGFAQHVVSEMHAIDVIRVRRFLHHELGVGEAGIDHWQRLVPETAHPVRAAALHPRHHPLGAAPVPGPPPRVLG